LFDVAYYKTEFDLNFIIQNDIKTQYERQIKLSRDNLR